MTAGYHAMAHETWLAIRDAIAKPWPDAAWRHDLIVWRELLTYHGTARPSLRRLADTWGCSEATARRRVAAHDVTHQRRSDDAPVTQPRRSDDAEVTQPPGEQAEQLAADDAEVTQPRRSDDAPVTQRRRRGDAEGTNSGAPSLPFGAEEKKKEEEKKENIQDKDSVARWARSVRGVPPSTVAADVERIVTAIRRRMTTPSQTTAAPVLGLFRAVGGTWPAFVADLLLVADAAHGCPDRLFARDIRAEGWADGVDRRRDVATICRRDRWQARIDTARAWDEGGRRSTAARGSVVAMSAADVEARRLEAIREQELEQIARWDSADWDDEGEQ